MQPFEKGSRVSTACDQKRLRSPSPVWITATPRTVFFSAGQSGPAGLLRCGSRPPYYFFLGWTVWSGWSASGGHWNATYALLRYIHFSPAVAANLFPAPSALTAVRGEGGCRGSKKQPALRNRRCIRASGHTPVALQWSQKYARGAKISLKWEYRSNVTFWVCQRDVENRLFGVLLTRGGL